MTKGLIFHIQRYSIHDGPGIRTTVFLKGCPLHCPWCANPESQSEKPELLYSPADCLECKCCERACPQHGITIEHKTFCRDDGLCTGCLACAAVCPTHALTVEGTWYTPEEAVDEISKDEVFFQKSGGGVTLSGGEPLLQEAFTLELLKRLKDRGYHTNIETSGYTSTEYLGRILPFLDLVYMDLKHPDSEIHLAKTGVGNQLILQNMAFIIKKGIPLVVRIPVIPRFNHSDRTAQAYGRLLSSIHAKEVHLLPFHQFGLTKWHSLGRAYEYEHDRNMDESSLESMASVLSGYGLHVQISGS